MKFEMSDDAVLKVAGTAPMIYAIHSYAATDHFHKFYFGKEVSQNDAMTKFFGVGLGTLSALTWTVAMSDDVPKPVKKNCLKTCGVAFGISAAQMLYNAENELQKKDVGYGIAGAQAALGALCLWKGFSNDDE